MPGPAFALQRFMLGSHAAMRAVLAVVRETTRNCPRTTTTSQQPAHDSGRPGTVSSAHTAFLTGRVIRRTGFKAPLTVGLLLGALAVLGLTTVGPDTPYNQVWPLFVLFGAACGLVIAPSTAAALVSVAPERAGMASGAVNTARQVGAVMGTALLGSLFTGRVTADLPHQLAAHGIPAAARASVEQAVASGTTGTTAPTGAVRAAIEDAFTSGVHAGLAVVAAVFFTAAVLALTAVHNRPHQNGTPMPAPRPPPPLHEHGTRTPAPRLQLAGSPPDHRGHRAVERPGGAAGDRQGNAADASGLGHPRHRTRRDRTGPHRVRADPGGMALQRARHRPRRRPRDPRRQRAGCRRLHPPARRNRLHHAGPHHRLPAPGHRRHRPHPLRRHRCARRPTHRLRHRHDHGPRPASCSPTRRRPA